MRMTCRTPGLLEVKLMVCQYNVQHTWIGKVIGCRKENRYLSTWMYSVCQWGKPSWITFLERLNMFFRQWELHLRTWVDRKQFVGVPCVLDIWGEVKEFTN